MPGPVSTHLCPRRLLFRLQRRVRRNRVQRIQLGQCMLFTPHPFFELTKRSPGEIRDRVDIFIDSIQLNPS